MARVLRFIKHTDPKALVWGKVYKWRDKWEAQKNANSEMFRSYAIQDLADRANQLVNWFEIDPEVRKEINWITEELRKAQMSYNPGKYAWHNIEEKEAPNWVKYYTEWWKLIFPKQMENIIKNDTNTNYPKELAEKSADVYNKYSNILLDLPVL